MKLSYEDHDAITVLTLSGELTVDTVSGIHRQMPSFAAGQCALDLSGVSSTDSAGLALLVHWIQTAANQNCALEPCDAPPQMVSLIRVSGLSGILPDLDFDS